jgi:hypothetical protein
MCFGLLQGWTRLFQTFLHDLPSLAKEGVTKVKAQVQISAGDSLIRLGVSNGQQVIQPDVRCD